MSGAKKDVADNIPNKEIRAVYTGFRNTFLIIGEKTQMQSFDLLFGLSLGYTFLRHLKRSLQRKDRSTAEDNALQNLPYRHSVKFVRKSHSADSETSLNEKLDELDVNKPTLPRRK